MAFVLKVKCDDEVHRIVLPKKELTYEDIQAAIHSLRPEKKMVAKYVDDEGDRCTLSPISFQDFLSFSEESKGRQIFRLELVVAKPGPTASHTECIGEQPKGDSEAGHEVAEMLKAIMGMIGSLAPNGGCPKDLRGGHFKKGKQLIWLLLQLHRNGNLTAKSAASLVVSAMPEILAHVIEHSTKIDFKAKKKIIELQPILEELCALVSKTEGLQQCELKIKSFMSCAGTSASDALLVLLTAVDTLSFESRVSFVETFYKSQEARLTEALAKADERMSWIPTMPLDHEDITCDGCNKCPIKGLRFKCQSCPDYDLCGDCFAQRGSIHGGECSAHKFERIKLFPFMPWMLKGKGKGKCKGTHHGETGGVKGKGKCKDIHHGSCSNSVEQQMRVCARPGCGFAATWHPTHCCKACKCFGNDQHGQRCGRMPVLLPTTEEPSSELNDGLYFEFNFPVVIEDGRSLIIAWNRGDDPKKVAENFAQQHGILIEELPTIQAFVEHATSISGQKQTFPEACLAIDASKSKETEEGMNDLAKEEKMSQAQMQLHEMGLGLNSEALEELLQKYDGSVEKIIEALSSDN